MRKYESIDRGSQRSSEGRKYQRRVNSRSKSRQGGMRSFGHAGAPAAGSASAKMQEELEAARQKKKVDARAQDRLARLEQMFQALNDD